MMRNRNLASLAALLLAIVCVSCTDSQPSEPGTQLYVDAWEPMVSPIHADTTYSSVIDAGGGEVLIPAADGSPNGYALIVDANTVKQPTRFSVHVLGGAQYVVDLHATQVGPRGVEVDVGKKLLKPVLLCMWYTDSPRQEFDPTRLTILYVPEDGSKAQPVKTYVEPDQKYVYGSLPHFSKYTMALN